MLRLFRIVLVALILIGVGVVAGQMLENRYGWGPPPEAYTKLAEAAQVVERNYVDEKDSEALSEGALRGLLSGLDPHSSYIEADRMNRVRESFEAEFSGIGVTYERIRASTAPDTAVIVSVIPGGPSDEAGLRPGDRLVRTDSTSLIGQPDLRIQSLLKGPTGTTVSVTVQRPGQASPVTYTVTRDRIPLNTVDAAYMMDEETGYIKLNRFARTTHREIRDALSQLKEDGMRRLVFDIRNNAGGLMHEAERVADEFLRDGQLVVTARGRDEEVVEEYRTQHAGLFETGPMIVLVNDRSASASEIVAGALHDHSRALIAGQRTYGKGLVQRQYELGDGSGLRLTIARFYTPRGRVIQQPYETGRAVVRPAAYADSASAEADTETESGGQSQNAVGGVLPDRTIAPDSVYQSVQRFIQQPGVRAQMRQWIDRNIQELRDAWEGRPEAFLATYELPSGAANELLTDITATPPSTQQGRNEESANDSLSITPHGRNEESANDSLSITPHGNVPGGPSSQGISRQTWHDYTYLYNTERGTILLQNALTSMIARRLFGMTGWIRVRNEVDPTIQATHDLWPHATTRAQTYAERL